VDTFAVAAHGGLIGLVALLFLAGLIVIGLSDQNKGE
jgi:hypothetical protein